MKLLFLIYSLGNGGAERVTANLANHWAAKGWHITIVTLASQSTDCYEMHPSIQRISIELANDSSNFFAAMRQNLRRVLALRRVLQETKPTVAISMMTTANVLLALSSIGLPGLIPIGSERVHPPQFKVGSMWEVLRRYTYGRLASVIALTKETADWLNTHTNVRQVFVIPNSVLWPLPRQKPYIEPRRISSADRYLILGVGRLDFQKGFDWLIDAFSRVSLNHPEWDLVILGEGPIRTVLEDQVRRSKLSGRVFFPGRAGNIGEWYAQADLYVMSSRFEGFPNTLIEAMSYGLPVVSFDCDTGPRDIIRHQIDGLLIPPGNINELTSILDSLMADPISRHRLAQRAIEVRSRYSMERIAQKWEKTFEEIRA